MEKLRCPEKCVHPSENHSSALTTCFAVGVGVGGQRIRACEVSPTIERMNNEFLNARCSVESCKERARGE